jgi:hypothetical protein
MLIASKEFGLDVMAQTATYTFMIQQRNAGQQHNIQTNNKGFENEGS